MAINSYSKTPSSNTTVGTVNTTGSAQPSELSDAIQEIMADLAAMNDGTATLTSPSISGNLTVSGTVDGRDLATDGSKLDGIESGATADQTASEILTAIKTVDGSGSGLDADTLDGSHASAFLTGNQTITLSGDVSGSGTTSISVTVADDSHNHVISNVDGLQTALDAKLASSSYTASDVLTKIKTVDGAGSGLDADLLDGISSASFLRSDAADTSTGTITSNPASGANILFQNGSGAAVGRITFDSTNLKVRGDSTKGLILGSNNTDVLTIDTSSNATFTGNINVGGTVDGRDVATDGSKLDGIEAGATADQSASEILTAIKTVDGSGSGLDADTLDGSHASAFLTGNQTITLSGDVTGSGTTSISTSIAANVVGASELNVSGNGTTSQFLRSDGDGTFSWATPTDTNTTYTAGGDYGMTLSGTEFRLEDDRRRNSTSTDVYSGNTHDYTFYDADVGIRWYTAGAEDMRLTDAGDLHVDGNVTAYSTTISDKRLKENIEPVENALDKIQQLTGYTFIYKNSGRESAGVIAQDVEQVMPSAVAETELPLEISDGQKYKTVQYDQLHALLIEAIKELTIKVERLENGSSV